LNSKHQVSNEITTQPDPDQQRILDLLKTTPSPPRQNHKTEGKRRFPGFLEVGSDRRELELELLKTNLSLLDQEGMFGIVPTVDSGL
jgi:hypothetical protein